MRRGRCIVGALLIAGGLLESLLWPSWARAQGTALDQVQRRGELVWGGDAEGGGPFVYPREDDPSQVRGFEVELAEMIAAKLGVKARFSQGQWDKLPELLDRGDIDLILNGYEWTPQWGQRFGASIPYYIYQLQWMARRDDRRLQTLEDLNQVIDGRRIRAAVLGGSAAETALRKVWGDSVDVVPYEGSAEAMRGVELAIDGVDATLQDLPVITFFESNFPALRRLGEPVEPGFYVALTRRGDVDLLQAVNRAILDCWRDGSFPKVLQSYGMWNRAQSNRGLVTDAEGHFQPDVQALDRPPTDQGRPSFWNRVPLLIQAAGVTILLSVTSMPLAILIGLGVALGRMYGPRWLRPPLGGYVELVRGTPLALQLYFIFFLLPELFALLLPDAHVSLPPILAAILGLAVNYSAYEAEIYRAGLQAVPPGQMEAALSLGMTRPQALRRVIVPQAMRTVIPPVTNDFIALFKDTAVCSLITVTELTKAFSIHARSTNAVVQLGLITALLYLLMSYPLSLLVGRMERRLSQRREHDQVH